MSTESITIHVDADDARTFSASSPEVREKLEILLSLRLSELVQAQPRSLAELMDEIGARAQSRGLTIKRFTGVERSET